MPRWAYPSSPERSPGRTCARQRPCGRDASRRPSRSAHLRPRTGPAACSARPSDGCPQQPFARSCCTPERYTSVWPCRAKSPNNLTFIRSADLQNPLHDESNDLVGRKEEQARRHHHDKDHDRRDQGFLPRRPGHLADFLPHFLQEFDRVHGGHRDLLSGGVLPNTKLPRESPRRLIGGHLKSCPLNCNRESSETRRFGDNGGAVWIRLK